MTLGFIFASLSWLIVGAMGTVLSVILGVFFYAIGEATQAPRFYEYVSSLAPKNQVGTFMGFAFLPVAIGSLTAGYLADWLRKSFLETNPAAMWYSVAAIGVASTLLMIIYNAFFVKSENN
jgi:MFS family permease